MTGVEIAIGCLFAWAARKARRVGARADQETDRALDAAMDRVHEVVSEKLGQETALARLGEEASAGRDEPTPETRQWLQIVLKDAVDHDEAFADALRKALDQLPPRPEYVAQGGNVVQGNVFHDSTSVQIGHNSHQVNNFGTQE
ncbi:hypothetical protein ABZ478_05065 [Streptomyces sp. NPDC005706]|uniref:hypothetical protein n=1 Tax=Streptomyces sp. NPDC005706 TaxID=3157169 RepID=UPI0033E298F2